MLRIPVSFRSSVDDEEHCHMILAIKYTKPRHKFTYALSSSNNFEPSWGALGISRLEKLMYKPLTYHSLSDLVEEFAACYKQYHHELHEVSFGHPFPHETSEKVHQWKAIKITPEERNCESKTSGELWTNMHIETLTRFSKACAKLCS